ncbi:MAG TPA: hypothetical protein EYO61_04325 [Campylobacterales bacterium]|nr:hypothetical protein [Campylobacterales bacterium]
MKKIYLLFFFTSLLFSLTDFDKGIKLFHQGKYQEAYKIFQELSDGGILEDDLDLYLAKSAFAIGKYEEALIAFERVLIEADENDRGTINQIRLSLAKTYLALNENELARKTLYEILDENPPQIVQDTIFSMLEGIDERKNRVSESQLNFFANLEFGYEENINSVTSENSDEQIDSLYIHEMGGIGAYHRFGDSSFAISSNLIGFNQNYIEDSNYNIDYFSFEIVPIYKMVKNSNLELPAKVEYSQFGGDELFTQYSTGVRFLKYIETQFVKAIAFDTFINYKWRKWGEEQGEDSDFTSFEYGLSTKVEYRDYFLSFFYSTTKEEAETEQEKHKNEIDKIINTIRLSYSIRNIADFLDFTFSYTFKNRIFTDYQAITDRNLSTAQQDKEVRKERYHNFGILFSKEILEDLEVYMNLNYTLQTSNHIYSEYDRFSTSVGVNYKF